MNIETSIAGAVAAVGCLLGVLMTALRLPGTWWILAVAIGCGWWGGWTRIAGGAIGLLVVLAIVGEAAEFGVSLLTARRAGASRRAAVFGMAGGLLGMILGAPFPPPLIAPILGAVAGCFIGAMLGEWWKRDRFDQGVRVGVFAAVGFAVGMAMKTALALCMSVIVVYQTVRSG